MMYETRLKKVSVGVEHCGQGTAAYSHLGLHGQVLTAHLHCGHINPNPASSCMHNSVLTGSYFLTATDLVY